MYRLLGFKKYDFVKDGQSIKGVRLYLEDDIPSNSKFGVCPETVSIAERILIRSGISTLFDTDELLGCVLRIYYNKYGKVEDIQVIED